VHNKKHNIETGPSIICSCLGSVHSFDEMTAVWFGDTVGFAALETLAGIYGVAHANDACKIACGRRRARVANVLSCVLAFIVRLTVAEAEVRVRPTDTPTRYITIPASPTVVCVRCMVSITAALSFHPLEIGICRRPVITGRALVDLIFIPGVAF